jgi:starch synthase
MKVLIASPEAVPYVKTGGLADVAGALCMEYRKMKKDARIVLPLYKSIKEGKVPPLDTGVTIKVPVGDKVIAGRIFSDESTFFIECDEFFDRREFYGTPDGDFSDNASRFVFFSRGILETCKAIGFKPDIIHCNDWQTGLVPLYLKTIYKADTFPKKLQLLTIHNRGIRVFSVSDIPLEFEDLFTPEV